MAELKYHLSRESLLKEQQLIQITKQANISLYIIDFYRKQTHLSTHFNFFFIKNQKKNIIFIQALENKYLRLSIRSPWKQYQSQVYTVTFFFI